MNSRKNLLSIALLFWTTTAVFAQQSNITQQRRALNAALIAIDGYSVWSTVTNDEAYYEFLDLFVSKDSLIYNDLLGFENSNNLTVEEYARIVRQKIANKKVLIKNIKNEGITIKDEKIHVDLSLDKEISYIDSCETYFSSSEFYGIDYRLFFTLVYDKENRLCKIERITGHIDSEKRLPSQYVVFMTKDTRDSSLTFRGHKLEYNRYHQAFIEGPAASITEKDFAYPDMSVKLKPVSDMCHMSMKYRIYRFRLKPHFDIGLGKTLSVENKSFYNTSRSKSNLFGVDVGYVFPSKKRINTSIYMGLGLTNSNIELSHQRDLFSFTTNQDIDNDTYERIYEDLRINQKTSIRELSVPIYVDFDWRFSKWISYYFDCGVCLNMNLSTSISDFSVSAENVHGLFPEYDNLYLDYHWGYNGFVQKLSLTKGALCEGERISVKKFVPDILFGTGLRFNIPRTTLAIDLGMGYQKGLNDIITISNNDNSEQYNGQLIYNDIVGGNSSEHVHDILENAEAISRGFLKINVGLIYKF